VDEVLRRLRDAGLTVNLEKMKLAIREIAFLGHFDSPEGIRIDPERTRAIRDFPPPKDRRGIDRFVGMANFYRRFVPNFAEMAEMYFVVNVLNVFLVLLLGLLLMQLLLLYVFKVIRGK
jgi:hypothetical protein